MAPLTKNYTCHKKAHTRHHFGHSPKTILDPNWKKNQLLLDPVYRPVVANIVGRPRIW